MSWNTIESDAGVFTQLVKDLGVKGIQFEDVPVLDMLEELGSSLYGVIFLFQYDPKNYSRDAPIQGEYSYDYPDSLFFAQQTISNACGTQAVLNTLLSIYESKADSVSLGETLTSFLDFTSAFKDAALRGETISNSEQIRSVHNSFSSPDPFVMEDKRQQDSGAEASEVFHFVGFIQHNGEIYELDGLQPAPIIHKEFGKGNEDSILFASNMARLLQQRISKISGIDGKFSVIAIIKDVIDDLNTKLQGNLITEYEYQSKISTELEKRDAWAKEIALRKQNLYGLVYDLLKQVGASMSDREFQEHVKQAQKATMARITKKFSENPN